jgi:hypothetical protein
MGTRAKIKIAATPLFQDDTTKAFLESETEEQP